MIDLYTVNFQKQLVVEAEEVEENYVRRDFKIIV